MHLVRVSSLAFPLLSIWNYNYFFFFATLNLCINSTHVKYRKQASRDVCQMKLSHVHSDDGGIRPVFITLLERWKRNYPSNPSESKTPFGENNCEISISVRMYAQSKYVTFLTPLPPHVALHIHYTKRIAQMLWL